MQGGEGLPRLADGNHNGAAQAAGEAAEGEARRGDLAARVAQHANHLVARDGHHPQLGQDCTTHRRDLSRRGGRVCSKIMQGSSSILSNLKGAASIDRVLVH
jgi:hypothetical protein